MSRSVSVDAGESRDRLGPQCPHFRDGDAEAQGSWLTIPLWRQVWPGQPGH